MLVENNKIISLRTAPNGRATKMSIRLPATSLDLVEAGSEPESDSDESNAEDTWSDWVSDSGRRCKSLFEDKLLASVTEALDYDKGTYGFDLGSFCKGKGGYIPHRRRRKLLIWSFMHSARFPQSRPPHKLYQEGGTSRFLHTPSQGPQKTKPRNLQWRVFNLSAGTNRSFRPTIIYCPL